MPVVMDKRLTDKIVRYFATQPIVKAWVFGSYARGEAHRGLLCKERYNHCLPQGWWYRRCCK